MKNTGSNAIVCSYFFFVLHCLIQQRVCVCLCMAELRCKETQLLSIWISLWRFIFCIVVIYLR